MQFSIPLLLAEVAKKPEQVNFDVGKAWVRVNTWVDGFMRMIPNIIVALIMMVVFFFVAKLVGRSISATFKRRNRYDLGVVLGGFVKWSIYIVGFLLSATVVIPSLKPGDLIAGLGVSSVAIGFAFKDILQNWLAGLLILLRQPFHVHDQISVNGHEGTVQRIETRATIIKTYDGQRIVIPNSDIYTNAIVVRTAHDIRRSEYDVGIGYGDGIENACNVIKSAIAKAAHVEADPGPEALVWDLAASWVTIRARWWTKSLQTDVIHTKSSVIQEIKLALDKAGIDMPFDTQVQLFHDQSEARDGERGRQREGWPAGKNGPTKPRWKEVEEKREQSAATSGDANSDFPPADPAL